MEAQRVIVENLPKPKKWWKEHASIIIAGCALIVSVYAICLSTQEFVAAHRPYVYVINRRDDKGIMDVKSVLLRCLNAPAKIINREFYYVVVKTKGNGEEEVTETIPLESSFTPHVLYPSEKTSTQIFFPYDFEREILADPNVIKLRRKARMDYKELSSDRTYYFEGNWDYNRQYNVWDTNNMFGD